MNVTKEDIAEQIDKTEKLIDEVAKLKKAPIRFEVRQVLEWVHPEGTHQKLIDEVRMRLHRMDDMTMSSEEIVLKSIDDFGAYLFKYGEMLDEEKEMADPTKSDSADLEGKKSPEDKKKEAGGEASTSSSGSKLKPWHMVVAGVGGLVVGGVGMFFAAPAIRGLTAANDQSSGEAAFGGYAGLSL
jgi:hypothetical protein